MISTLVLQYKPTMAFCYIFYSITHLSKALHGLLDEVSHTHSAAHAEHMPQHIMEHTGSFGLKHSQRGKPQISALWAYILSVNGLHCGILPSSFITQPLMHSFIDMDIYDTHLCPQSSLWGNQDDLWPLDTIHDQQSHLGMSEFKSP